MIEGVFVKPLKVLRDARGQVMHMLRCDDPFFRGFGEIYFSVVNAGVVKGWKRHQQKVQFFAVPRGNVKLVIYDDRPGSSSQGTIQEIFFGESDYQLVGVPVLVWYSFASTNGEAAMIANCATLPHDPLESEQIPLDDPRIPYVWKMDRTRP